MEKYLSYVGFNEFCEFYDLRVDLFFVGYANSGLMRLVGFAIVR